MNPRDIGSELYIANGGGTILGAGDSDAAIEGTAIDHTGFLSGVFAFMWGIDGPSIDDQAGIVAKVQDSPDNDTWADVVSIALACVTLLVSNVPVSEKVEADVDFSGCDKYVRGYVTPTRSSEEATSISVAILAILGGADSLPV